MRTIELKPYFHFGIIVKRKEYLKVKSVFPTKPTFKAEITEQRVEITTSLPTFVIFLR